MILLKPMFTFDEAISLFHVGAYGFFFQNQRGNVFTSELDLNTRLIVKPVEEEEAK